MDVLNALEKQAKRLEGSIAACEVGGSYADVAILHDRLTRCIELYADLIDSDYPVRHGSEKTAATTTASAFAYSQPNPYEFSLEENAGSFQARTSGD